MNIDITDLSGRVNINDDDIKKYIEANYYPEDIYTAENLNEWAVDNDYVKVKDDEISN